MRWVGRRAVLVVIAAIAGGASELYADSGSVESVCVISPTAEARVGNRLVETLPQGMVFRPDEKIHGWLWSNRHQGWIRSRDVLPLNEAILWFGRELQKHPDDARLYRSRAMARFAKSVKLNEAYALFAFEDINQSLRIEPNNVLSLCLRAQIYGVMESPERALADLDRATSLDPQCLTPRLLRVSLRLHHKEYDRAEAELAEILRMHPDSADAWLLRIRLHHAREDAVGIVAATDQVIRCNPYLASSYIYRAQYRLHHGQTQAALADAEAAVRLDPTDAMGWFVQAKCLAQRGRHDAAIKYYTRAIELNPQDADYYVGRAKAHFELRSKAAEKAANTASQKPESGQSKTASDQPCSKTPPDTSTLSYDGLVNQELIKMFVPSSPSCSQEKGAESDASKETLEDRLKAQGPGDPHAVAARADFVEAIRLAPANPELLAQVGKSLCSLPDLETASCCLDEAIALRPENAWTYSIRGVCRALQRDFARALSDFDLAVEKSPGDVRMRNVRAGLRIAQLDTCGAENDARSALEIDPQNAQAQRCLMTALMLQGRSHEAFEAVRESSIQSRDILPARLTLMWFLEGEFDRSERQLSSDIALCSDPNLPGHAMNKLWAKDPKKLLQAYEHYILGNVPEERPPLPMLRLRADLVVRRGQTDQAIAEYTTGVERFPCSRQLWVRRARAYLCKRDFERAAADIAQALSIDPQYSFALAARAELAIEQARLDAALDDCHAALRVDPESVEAYVQLARLWRMQGHFEQSLSDADAALSLNPWCPEAHRELGYAWLALRDDQAARDAFRKCLDIQTADAEAHFGIAEAYRILHRDELAIQHYHEALLARPDWAAALGGRGLVWLHAGDRAKASADTEAALKIDADELRGLTGRGKLRMLHGDYADAIADLRRALEIKSDFGEAAESLAWILAACPNAELRDGPRAVTLAKIAVRNRSTCNRLQALAAAYAEVGDFAAAEEAEKQALDFAPPFARKEFDDRLALFASHQPVRLELREPEATETVPVPEAPPDAPFEP